MLELWNDLTIARAPILLGAALAIVHAVEKVAAVVRRRRGLPVGDHCEQVEDLGERLDKLYDYVSDQLAELERIRDAAERTADQAPAGR